MSAGKPPRPPHPPADPGAIDASRFTVGGEELAVLTIPQLPAVDLTTLSPAERDVCLHMLRGLSNTEIAKARGTSINTVDNQIAAIFRKLGINSRSELAALVD